MNFYRKKSENRKKTKLSKDLNKTKFFLFSSKGAANQENEKTNDFK